ncbi:hypothetical protein VP01_277g3 [Puccinia sorghi]|uniref:Uncharacterized protein n=1 Tax=Puccinia sorghi TaxID=27349 RepID=A0A0L6V2R7_9BASI|nr:hypothetical protein VP01_277g3 [Puccinia sorghi]
MQPTLETVMLIAKMAQLEDLIEQLFQSNHTIMQSRRKIGENFKLLFLIYCSMQLFFNKLMYKICIKSARPIKKGLNRQENRDGRACCVVCSEHVIVCSLRDCLFCCFIKSAKLTKVYKVQQSFWCFSHLSPIVIQPSFDAQSLCRLHSDCATSTHANRWSLDGSMAGDAACQLQAVNCRHLVHIETLNTAFNSFTHKILIEFFVIRFSYLPLKYLSSCPKPTHWSNLPKFLAYFAPLVARSFYHWDQVLTSALPYFSLLAIHLHKIIFSALFCTQVPRPHLSVASLVTVKASLYIQSIGRLLYYTPKHSLIEPEQNGNSQTREMEEEVQLKRDIRDGKM